MPTMSCLVGLFQTTRTGILSLDALSKKAQSMSRVAWSRARSPHSPEGECVEYVTSIRLFEPRIYPWRLL